ncbi:MAG: hypothetical protein NTV57_02500 [Cyanobacteria bacterium]|nr:hypothetical protein [Cyanobacteriota bacterium]
MPQSPSASTIQPQQRRRLPGRRPWSWRRALGLGLCFGLGYGLTMRLLDLSVVGVWRDMQRFGVQSFPGTELDSLRKQYGDRQDQIRGDLDLLELERQQQRDAAELGKRQAEMADREQAQQQQNEADFQQLDASPADNQDSVASPAPAPAQESVPVPSPLITPPLPPAAPAPAAPTAEAPAASPPTTP